MGAGSASQGMVAPADPLVLLVGCPAELVAACREAGSRLAVAVEECDPGAIGASAARRPFAILVSEAMYRANSGAFDALTRKGSTPLLRLEDGEVSHEDAPRLLAEAVLGAAVEPGV